MPPSLLVRQLFYREASSAWQVEPHRHAVLQWIACVHGVLRVEVDGVGIDLRPEMSILIPPQALRAVRCPGRAPGYVVAIFAGSELDLTPITGTPLPLPALVRQDFQALIGELREPGCDTLGMQAALLLRLLLALKRQALRVADAAATRRPEITALHQRSHEAVAAQAERCLRAQLDRPWRCADVAAAVFLSSPHLARIFRHVFGRPVMRHLGWLRIEEAKRLLRESDRSVTQIAMQVGMPSPSHFSRVFRRGVGVSPGDYRRSGGSAYGSHRPAR